MEIAANLGCQRNGIFRIPLKFRIAIEAVKTNEVKVIIPKYIISGFPKIGAYEISWNIESLHFYSAVQVWIDQICIVEYTGIAEYFTP